MKSNSYPPVYNYRSGMPQKYESIGTLCDEPLGLTCSFFVARKWAKAKLLIPFPTFEAAEMAVKDGSSTGMLVPASYPGVGKFIIDVELRVEEVFIYPIPDLVLVGQNKMMPLEVEKLFSHPATDPLKTSVPIIFKENQHVTSNTKAITEMMQYHGTCVAITNRLAANSYGVCIYKVLRSSITMPWVIFVKN